MRVLLLLALLLLPASLHAQQVQTAVVPDAITVGDVFHAVIRVTGAGEGGAVFPDSLSLPPDLELAGRRELRRDTIDGELAWTAIYPLTAWRTGTHTLPPAEVRVTAAGAARIATASFREVAVRSVLPADTAGIEPKPAKDVLGGNRVWWPIILGALLLLLALAVLLWWWRRRRRNRPVEIVAAPSVAPRERALQALDAARTSGAMERGDAKRFYTEVSDALREYLSALDPRFGTDLTTTELALALRGAGRERDTAELRRVLQGADLVKFARRRPSQPTAQEEWERARGWVAQYDEAGTTQERAA